MKCLGKMKAENGYKECRLGERMLVMEDSWPRLYLGRDLKELVRGGGDGG